MPRLRCRALPTLIEEPGVSENENNTAEPEETLTDTPAAGELLEAEGEISEADGLRAELERAQIEATTAREDMLRARAEAENVRKRAERDVVSAHKFGLERFIGQLLPVKDSMDFGFDALDGATDIGAIREGMDLTRKMLEDALDKNDVVTVDPLGEAFDPEFHQAMTMQPSAEAVPGTILVVMQKGYVLNERLIRPAMVVVAKAIEEDEAG
jgi:molecular chaperone GrpE